ncbi:MAG: arginase [Bosea sp.]|jgi:arginase|nr:arginase [Bosea sp. (in: a-proteobacteria)]
MNCVLIGMPVADGAGRAGADAGPRALRAAGIREALQATGVAVHDRGNLALGEARPEAGAHPNPALKALSEVAAWTAAIADAVSAVPHGQVPVMLGGDHSISMGTLTGLSRRAAAMGRPLFVLWIDAHPDCHTLDTTESGHLHGTPVAYALGVDGFGKAFPAVTQTLAPSHLCMIGLRSIDAAEASLIARLGIEAHAAAALTRQGVAATLEPFLERVRAANGLLHVSFDADAIDPSEAPGVGTPVADGLSLGEARAIMATVRRSGLLASLDLVEVNPFLDRDRRTARLMASLAADAIDARSRDCGNRRASA